MDDAALTWTAHNIVLPDGTQTFPDNAPVAENGICQAALRDLELAFPGWIVPPRVADLGCLEGGYTVAFARAGYDVTGFDARAENIACCDYAAARLQLPNLQFTRQDVRDTVATANRWDAVFCCGLLYHLDEPAAFLARLGKAVKRLLIVQTHYSTRPDSVHEGRRGHWYTEGYTRWSSWENAQSFWMTRKDLMAAIRDAGFPLVFEQADYREDITAEGYEGPDERSMFVGLKV